MLLIYKFFLMQNRIMNKLRFFPFATKPLSDSGHQELRFALLCIGLLFILIVVWYIKLKPVQNQYQTNLSKYPAELANIQDLNQRLLNYKNSDVPKARVTETEFIKIKNKLIADGLQLGSISFDGTSQSRVNIEIKEIDFHQWLILQDDLRKKYGLFIDKASILRGNDSGIVSVNVSLIQNP